VLFDTVVNDQAAGISYDPVTGEFTLSEEGNYRVTWWVASNGAGAATVINFGVVLDAGAPVLGSTTLLNGQVMGMALITVSPGPGVLSLVNDTGDTVNYADTPVQADIMIEQVQ
jgi:hypothetical protein